MKQNHKSPTALDLSSIALTEVVLLSFATVEAAETSTQNPAGKPEIGLPFAESLQRPDVAVDKMKNGQRESLPPRNGDLCGLDWEKDNCLFMRIITNDLWNTRVDTSSDGELLCADPAKREVIGPDGAPASYDLPYPQPRCAVSLGLGLVPEEMRGNLNFEKTVATITSGNKAQTALRIPHQQNVHQCNLS